MELLDRLVDDARLRTPGTGPPAWTTDGWLAEAPRFMRRLVVPDRELSRVAKVVPTERPIPVSVVNTSGAGGLVSLARRTFSQLVVESAESALRDLDDLAQNASRVVAAARELSPEVEVFVGLPHAPGWHRAVEVVEAAGCFALVDLTTVTPQAAVTQLSALVEADLAFKVSGLPAVSLPALLVTVAALVDDAGVDEATPLLSGDAEQSLAVVAGWDSVTQSRVRRRLRSYDSVDPGVTLAQLRAAGLIAPV